MVAATTYTLVKLLDFGVIEILRGDLKSGPAPSPSSSLEGTLGRTLTLFLLLKEVSREWCSSSFAFKREDLLISFKVALARKSTFRHLFTQIH